MNSWKPAVQTVQGGEFNTNALAFATKEEAEYSASELASRWMLVIDYKAIESDQSPNYRLDLTTGVIAPVVLDQQAV